LEFSPRHPAWIAIMLLAIGVEILWRLRSGRGYDRPDAFASLRLAAGNLVFGAVNAFLLAITFTAAARFAPVHWPMDDWRVWAVGFVLVEFAYYWFHRLSHEMRWLWTNHVVHHSTEHLTLLSSLRVGWTNYLSAGWIVYIPLVLAGFDPRLILVILGFDLHYQFFLHTEVPGRLGPLEWILNTPAHHRVHHASNDRFLDKNYGGAVIIFDRMFGTFAEAGPEDTLVYGTVHKPVSQKTLSLALGEWRRLLADMRRAPTVMSALRMAVARP
jgi:sterol desaturase/sphingolipid hydroxylase (fatty acid hydroxylase superfamily)